MYGRYRGAVQTCSRRLAGNPSQTLYPSSIRSVASQRRHGTASDTQEADHNDGKKQHDGHRRGLQKQSNWKYRHFRPYKSTELGLDSLGKPTEVIILPSRDRKLPETFVNGITERKTRIHDIYNNDSSPISWEEIQRNLLTVRDSVIPENQLSVQSNKWNELRKAVSQSFTREQLAKYLNENASSTLGGQAGLETTDKRALAAHIMTRVWKLTTAAADRHEQHAEGGRTPDDPKDPTVQLKANKNALDLALRGGGHKLRDISEQLQVQIDVFRDKSKVSVTGKTAAVRHAKATLQQILSKPPLHRIIELSDSLRALSQAPGFDKYVRSLTQKYAVHIVRKTSSLTIYADKEASLDATQQCLTHLLRSEYRNAGHNFLSTSDTSTMTKVRMYPSTLSDSLLQQQNWYRWRRRGGAQREESSTQDDDARNIISKVKGSLAQRRLPSIESIQRVFSFQPESLKREIVAKVGQALTNNDRATAALLQSTFTSSIPLLPQALSSKEVSLDVASHEKLLLLRLQPRDESAMLPSFDVYMMGDKIEVGLKQALRMAKVQVRLGSAIHDVLLPSEQLDIRLTESVIMEVYNSDGGASLPRHVPFLRSIAALVKAIQTQESVSPGAVHYLDLLPLFNEAPKLATLASKQTDGQPSLSKEVTQLLASIKDQKSRPFESAYFAEPVEWLDRVIYSHPLHPEIRIEHTISGSLLEDGSVSRQSLTIFPAALPRINSSTTQPAHDHFAPGDADDALSKSEDDQLESVLPAAIDLVRQLTRHSNAINEAGRAEDH